MLLLNLQPASASPLLPSQGVREKTTPSDHTLMKKARRALRTRKLEKSVKHLQTLLTRNPTHQRAWWHLSTASLFQKDWTTMHHALTELLILDPSNQQAKDRHAYADLRRKGFDQTLKLPPPGRPSITQSTEILKTQRVTLVAGGDLHLGRISPTGHLTVPKDGVSHWLQNIRPFIQQGELAFANLETVLLDEGSSQKCSPRSTACSAFRVPTSFATGIGDTGFNLLSTANNHSGDFGISGILSTTRALNRASTHHRKPIHHSGATGQVATITVRGIRISMVAFGTGSWLPYRVTEVREATKIIRALAKQSDIVIVSVHAGAEGNRAQHVPHHRETFYGENRGHMRHFSHGVIDAGADLVLGHGPHVLRGMELYRDRVIAYSLGNLSSYRTLAMGHPKNISALLHLEIDGTGQLLLGKVIPLILSRSGRPGHDPKNRAIQRIRHLSTVDFPRSALPLDSNGVIVLKTPKAPPPNLNHPTQPPHTFSPPPAFQKELQPTGLLWLD